MANTTEYKIRILRVGAATTIAPNSIGTTQLLQVAQNKMLGRASSGTGNIELLDLTAAGRALIDDADAAAQRATLGLVIGANVQAYSAELAAIAALTTTNFGRSVLAQSNAAALRALAGLVIGTDVQAQDAELAAIAGLTSAANKLPYFTGSGTAALADLTAFARTLLDDVDAATVLATLGAAASANATLTGTPTAPTATTGTNTTQISTTAFVQAAIANLVASSPSALDTLNELAAALGNDANFATTITNALALKAPLASPSLTGTPTSPTAAGGTNTTQIATTAFVANGYQPLDSDLTAIAALATTVYGRALLTLADVAALQTTVNGTTVISIGANGKYVSLSAALATITDASATKRYTLVMLENITEAAGLTWKAFVNLNLNGFLLSCNSTGGEATITFNDVAGAQNHLIWSGTITRTTSTQNNTYVILATTTSSSCNILFSGVTFNNTCTGTDCHAVVVSGNAIGTLVNCPAITATGTGNVGIVTEGANGLAVWNCAPNGVIAKGSSNLALKGGQIVSQNSAPAVQTFDAAMPLLENVNIYINSSHGIQCSDGAGVHLRGSQVTNISSRTRILAATATRSDAMTGVITGLSITVNTAGSAGATIKFGSSAGGADVADPVLIDTVGVKTIIVKFPQPLVSTLHTTITGTGASVDIYVFRAANAAARAINLLGSGRVQITHCQVESGQGQNAIELNATAAAAANVEIFNSLIKSHKTVGGSAKAINAASACTLQIQNCVFEADVALGNVTITAPTSTYGSNIHR